MDDVTVCVVSLDEDLGQRIPCGQVEFANSTDGYAQRVALDDSELERGTGLYNKAWDTSHDDAP